MFWWPNLGYIVRDISHDMIFKISSCYLRFTCPFCTIFVHLFPCLSSLYPMICTCIPWYPFILYSMFSPNTSSHIYGSGICIPFSNGLGIFIQSNFALTLFSRSIPFFPHHSPHNRWFIKITPKNMNLLYHIHFWWTSSIISWPKVFSWVLLFFSFFSKRK